ncbi:unnamed protein product [Rhizoctonia solani]|uniref:Benzoate 4-monooxygenase n=1 Tax=Rhizoctonia solani TaxID=456999 RepID=A0A8H2Y0N0_9AGAM|nr:unnamed protein product [Rhizoctonia solani]
MNTESPHLVQYSTALGVLAFAFYVVPYLLDPYDYRRRFPGPPLAGLTNWWMSNIARAGRHSEAVKQLHERYGTFVRLGPNHISIADPDALEIVYGHGSGVLKSEFYRIFQNGSSTDVFNTSDKVEHSSKWLKYIDEGTTHRTLSLSSPVCEEAARGVSGVNWVSSDGKAVMNVCAQFSYLAFDIIGDLALGSPFGLIQAQKDSSLSIESVDASGEPVRGTVEVPVVKTIANLGVTIMSVGVFPVWTHKLLQLLPWNISGVAHRINLFKLATTSVDARIRRGPTKNSEDGKRSIDLIDKLLEARNEDGNPLSVNELYAEALLLLIAGSDTTSKWVVSLRVSSFGLLIMWLSTSTLSSLCYHLAIHPEVQQELHAELDQHIPYDSSDEADIKEGLAVPPYDAIVLYDDIKNLPYLNACVKEALRIHSTVGTGLPRVVPPGKTITVAGQTFKAGSVISVPSYTTNRSSVWGDDAGEFRPRRWLEDDAGPLNKYFVPFSMGPRACIGRNLAYMDLMLIVATLFRRYHVEALPTTKMITHETFVREAAHCEVAIHRRTIPAHNVT